MTEDKNKLLEELRGIKRVVINDCYGGFGLSEEATQRYKELAGITEGDWSYYNVARDDPYLVQVVRELGHRANGPHTSLKIVELPGNVKWHIGEYDGNEWVAEDHRTWS
jgi:hypothetical protein